MAIRFTPAQQAFIAAVEAGESRTFHKAVVVPVVDLDRVWWALGDFMPMQENYDSADFVPAGGQR